MAREKFVPSFKPGDRVEIAPHYDLWMRGDRYGDVVKHSERFGVYVKMDKSGKTLRFSPEGLTLVNPGRKPSKAARRYIGRKIRRLAHEGVPAPRRVAAAYRMARRKGYRVPKRGKRNARGASPLYRSEGEAWRRVMDYARRIIKTSRPQGDAAIVQDAYNIMTIANEMGHQLARGIHRNPLLGIFGANPKTRIVRELGKVVQVRYKRKDDGKLYFHDYTSRPRLLALSDGSIWIKG